MNTTKSTVDVQLTVRRRTAVVNIEITRTIGDDQDYEDISIPVGDIDWLIGALQRAKEMEPKP
jgi:hypothetical protein